jgi:CheY-like chemotaxis protein
MPRPAHPNIPRVVLIDDDPHQAKFIKAGLNLLAFNVEYVRSVDQARRKLEAREWSDVALFLVDVMMPHGKSYSQQLTRDGEITGFFLARDIRSHLPSTPIILWSTDPLNSIEKEAREFVRCSVPRCTFLRKEDAVKKVLLCYQGYVDGGQLDSKKPGSPVTFERLLSLLKVLAPPIATISKAWLGQRDSK